MIEKNNVDGKIIKINKLWWLKINRKSFRTSPIDGATFPYKLNLNIMLIIGNMKKVNLYIGLMIALL